MSKLLKHLGLGRDKKGPPQPPKPDYSAQKTLSFDGSQQARSPTSEKGMSTTSSQISGFDMGQLQGSPGHRPGDKGYGGARPKDTGGGMSPHSLQTRPSVQSFGIDEGEAPASGENGGSPGATAGPSATPVRCCFVLSKDYNPSECDECFYFLCLNLWEQVPVES